MKARIKFSKTGNVKFIGHLDVMRYFQKLIRRAKLDVTYSQGYHPHQIMSFTSQIKEEISSIKNTKSETIAELSGFIRNNGYFLDNTIILTTENKKTVEREISKFIIKLAAEIQENTKKEITCNICGAIIKEFYPRPPSPLKGGLLIAAHLDVRPR